MPTGKIYKAVGAHNWGWDQDWECHSRHWGLNGQQELTRGRRGNALQTREQHVQRACGETHSRGGQEAEDARVKDCISKTKHTREAILIA